MNLCEEPTINKKHLGTIAGCVNSLPRNKCFRNVLPQRVNQLIVNLHPSHFQQLHYNIILKQCSMWVSESRIESRLKKRFCSNSKQEHSAHRFVLHLPCYFPRFSEIRFFPFILSFHCIFCCFSLSFHFWRPYFQAESIHTKIEKTLKGVQIITELEIRE